MTSIPSSPPADLHTFFTTRRGIVKAVNNTSYSVREGETLGIVGESGSGKSVSAMSILRLLDGNGYIDSGKILFNGRDLTKISMEEMYEVRGNEISVIFQEPMTSLNPVFTIEKQISEVFRVHQNMDKKTAAEKSVEILRDVKIPNPEIVVKQYPHQLSGGMRQRVMIAMALACRPKLLIADEPTTALDVTIQAQVLRLMNELKKEFGTSIYLFTINAGETKKFTGLPVGQVLAPLQVLHGKVRGSGAAHDPDLRYAGNPLLLSRQGGAEEWRQMRKRSF